MLLITELRTEYRVNPLGIDTERPRFNWKLWSDKRGTVQTHRQVQVSEGGNFTSPVWDTGREASGESIQLEYAGPGLRPLTLYHVRVRAWDNHGRESDWHTGTFETGFLGAQPWQARWITCDLPKDPPDHIPPWILRRRFRIHKPVARARAYVTALGVYELSLNGRSADDSRLSPGWTSYNNWLQYQVYDITGAVAAGDNTVEALLGEGWYNGDFTFEHRRNLYGEQNALLLELHLTYGDGTTEVIGSDESFRAATGPILLSDIYNGEIYDARLEGEEHRQWRPVSILEHRTDHLTASVAPPVRPIEEVRPVALLHTPAGETVIDMGQNMVGYLRFRVRGEAGQTVHLKHCEVLDRDGNFYPGNIRLAKQEIHYTLRGGGVEEFRPHFTFQGFRYVKVLDYPGKIDLADITGVVLHTDMEPTGQFSCSSELVNRLQHNILWGQKGNFVDVPTDCPQRDERMGWTADAQVFIPTACFNMDCALFFTKWLRDLRADQKPGGAVSFVIPDVLPSGWGPLKVTGDDHASATWGDAATIGPWVLYQRYGDKRILADSFDSMRAWLAYCASISDDEGVCRGGAQLGDWLALDAYEGSYHGATPNEYVATAYYAYSAGLTARVAAILGREEDSATYHDLHERIVAGFRKEFLPEGRPYCDTQTGYILPLVFDLVEGDEKRACIEGLADHLERHNRHLTTGFVGTPYLCQVLSDNGRADLAYELLLHEDFPSWLYQVKKGATTVWEHWDGIMEDGSFWSDNMNSFNHYAYGSIGDWLYRAVAGIDTAEDAPGYKHIVFRPLITDRLDHAEAEYQSVHGRVACGWERSDGVVKLRLEIPVNTMATLRLPADVCTRVVEDSRLVAEREGQSREMVLELGSGSYLLHCFA